MTQSPREEIEQLLGRHIADNELNSVTDLNAFPESYLAEAAKIEPYATTRPSYQDDEEDILTKGLEFNKLVA